MKHGVVERAKREAIQPSLWDRLLNDLPGLGSEIEGMRAPLAEEFGEERLAALLESATPAVEGDASLSSDQKQRLRQLMFKLRHRAQLERQGVVVSPGVLREAVRRDIEALFNTERFESSPLLTDGEMEGGSSNPPALDDFPEVRRSVVNYGVPSFSGRSSHDFDREALAREIRGVLDVFEPRLKPGATKVVVITGDKSFGIRIDIDAILIMTPTPERMRLRTSINLDNGAAQTELRDA